jgi:opacity protein-like surface antigen
MLFMTCTRSHLLLIATTWLALATAPAHAEGSDPGLFDGFYAGAEIGAAQSTSKTVVTPVIGAALSHRSDTTSANFGAFAGYGKTLGNGLYLGTELDIGSGAGKSRIVALGGINTQEKITYQAALSTRIGFMLGDETMLYAIAGSVVRESKFTSAGNRVRTVTLSGSSFGFGLMQSCTENVFIRAELERTDLNSKTYAGALQPTTRYEPSANVLSVGIGYRF